MWIVMLDWCKVNDIQIHTYIHKYIVFHLQFFLVELVGLTARTIKADKTSMLLSGRNLLFGCHHVRIYENKSIFSDWIFLFVIIFFLVIDIKETSSFSRQILNLNYSAFVAFLYTKKCTLAKEEKMAMDKFFSIYTM